MYSPPDRPLIVKCTFDKWHKRITFNSARNCSYELLRHKVEQCFSLYGVTYAIAYKDDDGEINNISTDADLLDAVQYFQVGDDAPLSSAASILSGRSFGPRKITLRVDITVEYDGPSLSDTSSLASLDEFKNRNGSELSFSFGSPSIDDDSVTVSSRDPGTKFQNRSGTLAASSSSLGLKKSQSTGFNSTLQQSNGSGSSTNLAPSGASSRDGRRPVEDWRSSSLSNDLNSVADPYPEETTGVFERLKLEEALRDDTSSVNYDALVSNERGAAWLREQNDRANRLYGGLSVPSDSDGVSLSLDSQEESLSGDLALERDPSGRYYYTYTSSSASQAHGSIDGDGHRDHILSDPEPALPPTVPRPNSLQLNWLRSQQVAGPVSRESIQSGSHSLVDSIPEEPIAIPPSNASSIDPSLRPFLPVPNPPVELLTDCSSCGILLDSIRYVCSTCGEKPPVRDAGPDKGKGREDQLHPNGYMGYPPDRHRIFSSPNSSSSRTFIGSTTSFDSPRRDKPLPSIPGASPFSSLPSLFTSRRNAPPGHLSPVSPHLQTQPMGYELCPGCLESAGVDHAVEAGLGGPGQSPSIGNFSPDDPQLASQLRRAAPKKGQLRHAYYEKIWGSFGWEDVVQDEEQVSACSTCTVVTPVKRYKCVSCTKMNLCRACYSQVHELHPSHAFLAVPDKPQESSTSSETMVDDMPEIQDELSLKHAGVKCAHCLRDIVGARFHCAICPSIDICSNCESAGLPGNLDSADGGHISSHILIKIPYPLENTELQSASRRALHLWTGRDAANVGILAPRSRANSEVSGYAQTMIGSRPGERPRTDHRTFCESCKNLIVGVRYQCGHCPSSPTAYSLCAACEVKSYLVHDPMHVFFKLPRPVYTPLESPYPMLPPLYKVPAGPPPGSPKTADPRAYLSALVNHQAICDRCIRPIQGEWFRCCYCPLDLCDTCEEVDTHNETHVFLVFKSLVDMTLFKSFAKPDNPNGGRPVIAYPIYR